ncbi:hypothetical protein IGI04_042582 [Brassica rapa subsp. trilocularis]|uniref:DUF4283 domain-containing protein n=2 Tax=Brassica rapa subsp. trilocularis TaxID=1813537 RepID=A0ABQ7KLK5_BRACM|nr:hypothetical protein IGI04_042582 [Brassica rapa subsp. trilocularis]
MGLNACEVFKAWKVILLHFGELPTTKEPLDKEGAVWIRFPQAREAGDRLFSGGNMDMKHESSGVVKIQEENKWVWPRWVKTALGSCEIWSNQEGAKRKKGRLRRRSKAQIRRGRCWKRSILSGYQGSYGTMKMGREEAQQILMGECSYSAYMGESVESSGVMRKLETKGADERVTKDEWDEFVKTTPLDHERGNGTESGEQEQNQEDSGLHDQVENNVQSSGEVDEVQSSGEVDEVQSSGEEQVGPASSEDEQVEPAIKAWKVILLHFGELPTTKEPLDKEGAVWIRFPQAREAGDRL